MYHKNKEFLDPNYLARTKQVSPLRLHYKFSGPNPDIPRQIWPTFSKT